MLHEMLTATLALTVHAAAPRPLVLADSVRPAAPATAGPRRVDRFAAGLPALPDVPVAVVAPGVSGAGSPALADVTPAAVAPVVTVAAVAPLAADTPVKRERAVEHSDAYYTRLTIHRIGSYAMLPLFGAEWYLGQRLINTSTSTPPSWVKPTHRAVAYGIYTIFGVNTVTGLWNAWEARNDTDDRARRWIHVATMLASDAGFVATAATVNQAKLTLSGAQRHRDIAIASISLSAASTVFMWLTK